jgi:predicted dehydrogenase
MKMNMPKHDLKIGIIGCGRMARVHLGYILENVPKKNIVVCDLDEIKAEAFAEESQIKEYFSHIDKMLAEFKPDICHIITPPHTHAEVAIECMNQGSHVFIEKPMCTTLADADQIVSTSNKAQRIVCVGHQRLFEQPIMEAKRLIDAGQFGAVVHVAAVDSNDSLELSKSGFEVNWASNLPGGKFFDYLPHLVYLLEYFISGLNLQDAYCIRNSDHHMSDLYASFSSNNAMASLHISLSSKLLQNYLRIECTEGVIHIDSRNYITFLTRKRNLPNAIERVANNLGVSYQIAKGTFKTVLLFGSGKLRSYEGTGKLIARFYDTVLQGSESPISSQKGKEIVRSR